MESSDFPRVSEPANTNISKDFIFHPPKTQQFINFCSAFGFVGFSFQKIQWNPDRQRKEIRPPPPKKWEKMQITHVNESHSGFAVVCGKASGISGIDCDTPEAYTSLIRDFPELKSTLTVKTKKGFHIYCKYDARVPTSVGTFQTYPNVDIRNDNGMLFAPPTCYAADNEIYEYQVVVDGELQSFPEKLVSDIKPNKLNRKRQPKKQDKLTFSQKNPSSHVIELYQKLLDELDSRYFDETLLWANVGAALHWSCDCPAFLELWIEFSKKSKLWKPQPARKDFQNRWRLFNDTCANAVSLGTLKAYHRDSKNTNKSFINYNKLNLPKPFNLQKDIDSVANVQIHKVNRAKVWNNHDTVRNVLPASGEILALGFDTGQGKTYAAKKYREALGNIDIITPTPRRVVAAQAAKQFDIRDYQTLAKGEQHGLNEAIQIDSLWKMNPTSFIGTPFFLFLDEFDQVAEHFLADTMQKHRLENLDVFTKLIQHATYVVIADANLSTRCMRFLRGLTPKPVQMYLNQFVEQRTQGVTFYNEFNTACNALVRCINANEKVFVCSDRLTEFERRVIAPIRTMFPLKSCIVHTSEDQHPDVLTDVSVHWRDIDIIFANPAVTSGIDYDPKEHDTSVRTHAVFAFYFGGSIDALKDNQQINRIRNPTEINVWCADGDHQNQWNTDGIEKNINALEDITTAKKIVDANTTDNARYANAIQVLKQLRIDSQFINQYLSSHVGFHIEYLLQRKGYTDIAHVEDDVERLVSADLSTPEFYQTYRTEKVSDFLSDATRQTLEQNFPHLGLNVWDKIVANRMFYVTVLRFSDLERGHTLPVKSDVLSSAYSIKNQWRLCRKLCKYLHLNWLDFDIIRDLTAAPSFIVVPNDVINEVYGVFQINYKPGKVGKGNTNYGFAHLYQMLLRMLQHIYPAFIGSIKIESILDKVPERIAITFKNSERKTILQWRDENNFVSLFRAHFKNSVF